MKKINLTKKITGVNVDFNISVFDELFDNLSKFNFDALAFAANDNTFISLTADKYCFSLVTNGEIRVNKLDGDNIVESYDNGNFEILKNLVESKEIYTSQYEVVDSNSFQIEYGVIENTDGDIITFNRIDEPVDFNVEASSLEDLITVFVSTCENILEDVLYKYEIIGEILEDGEVEKGQTNQGLVYKNPLAFRQKNGICYISELHDYGYTYEDILNESNGNEDIANIIFNHLDWQSPSTLYHEYVMEDEIFECTNCKQSYLSYEVDKCPFCECKKVI